MIALAVLVTLGGFEPQPLLPGKPWALQGHTDAVVAIAFSPDSARLVSAGRDKTLKLWDLTSGALLKSVPLGEQQLTSLAFSPDGKRLAAGDVALQAQVLDAATLAVLKTIAHPDAVAEVAFSADGSALAIAGLSDTSGVYDVEKGTRRYAFRGRTARFTSDGKHLLSSSGAGALLRFDAKTGKAGARVKTGLDSPLATATPDGALVAAWTPRTVDVQLWNAQGKALPPLKGPVPDAEHRAARVTGVALTVDGARLISGGGDGVVRLWDVAKAAVVQSWPADKNSAVAVSPDGKWVAVADAGLVKLWKLP